MNNDKALSLLGLAKKAGKLKSGEYCVEEELKKGRAKLVIVANDASDNTKKKFTDKSSFKKVPLCFYSDKAGLGKSTGNEERAVLVIIDENFAKAINEEILKRNNQN